MSRKPGPAMARVYLQHWRWLLEQGPSYKLQAASCKRQALELTRLNYRSIREIRPGGWQLKLDEARSFVHKCPEWTRTARQAQQRK